MGNGKVNFVCSDCGMEFAKWQGNCSSCGNWNTIKEFKPAKLKSSGKNKNYSGQAHNQLQSLEHIESLKTHLSCYWIMAFNSAMSKNLV